MRKFVWISLWLAGSPLILSVTPYAAQPAAAEVRFGRNVRIGGHDFSNQTFSKTRRGIVYLYHGRPARPGCRAQKQGHIVTKICHLQARRR